MKLDEVGERYADQLFAQRREELSKEHERKMQEVRTDIGRRNLSGSGIAASAKVANHLSHIRAIADARVQSYLKAYEKSGTLLEEADIDLILATVIGMVSSNISHLVASNPELSRLRGHMENERDVVVAENRRNLRIHLDSLVLEARRKKRFTSVSLHNLFENEYQRLRQKLDEIDPTLMQQIMEASDRLEQSTTEAIAHCALTCRRALKSFADAVYPPTDKQPSGRVLDDARFVNRLWQYVHERLAHKSSRDLVELSLESLGRRVDSLNELASKGVHSSGDQREAERCLIQTIYLLSELCEL